MQILSELIDSLDLEAPVRDIRVGTFHTGVWTRHCGLASSMTQDALKEHREGEPLIKEPGQLMRKNTRELVEMVYSDTLTEAAIGLAAINSLIPIDDSGCIEQNAFELLAEKGRGKTIAIVGHFPFIPKLKAVAAQLFVIEKNPQPGDLNEEMSEKCLPAAEVVGLTGTTLTNHTAEHLLSLCRPGAYVVMLGDSAPLSPVLFKYGVDAISGTRVENARLALDCLSQGATYRQIQGIRKLIKFAD